MKSLSLLVISLLISSVLGDGHFSVQLQLTSLTPKPVQTTLSLRGSEKTITVTGTVDVTVDYKLTPAQLTDKEPILLDIATVTDGYHTEALELARDETREHTVAGLLRVSIQKSACAKDYYGNFCARKCTVPAGDRYSTCDSEGKLTCANGWTGPACDHRVCPACKHGRCDETTGQCVCKIGFTGPACDQCIPAPGCRNGTCKNDVPGTCSCRPGWGGPLCENDLSLCASRSPCAAGSRCEMKDPFTYICICPTDKTGRHCDINDISPVSTDKQMPCPCQNGGLCLPTYVRSAAPVCQCAPGFAGRHCETTVPSAPHHHTTNSVLVASNITLCLIVFFIGLALMYLIYLARRYLKMSRPSTPSSSTSTAPLPAAKHSSVSLLMPDCGSAPSSDKGADLFAAAYEHSAGKKQVDEQPEESRYTACPSRRPTLPTISEKIYECLPPV